jgi:hypothetical protein
MCNISVPVQDSHQSEHHDVRSSSTIIRSHEHIIGRACRLSRLSQQVRERGGRSTLAQTPQRLLLDGELARRRGRKRHVWVFAGATIDKDPLPDCFLRKNKAIGWIDGGIVPCRCCRRTGVVDGSLMSWLGARIAITRSHTRVSSLVSAPG